MSNRNKITSGVLAAVMTASLGVAGAASAQSYGYAPQRGGFGNGVLSCDAPGGRQQAGAGIGAVLGGLIGSRISRNERTAGAIGGAAVGAAAGSYIGCRQQRQRAAQQASYGYNYNYGQAPASSGYVASSNLRVRSGPGTGYAQVGSVSAGQSLQVVGAQGDWLQLAGGGYVNAGYVNRY